MIRTTLLWMVVAFLGMYAWRDWYKSLCGLIVLMAVVQHPDFPNSIMGIQGLNPWNVLMLIVVAAWLSARGKENLNWDLARQYRWLLGIFFLIIFIAYVRAATDTSFFAAYAEYFDVKLPKQLPLVLFSEYVINSVKWVVPALLLYDGCRDEKRFRWALYAILLVYLLLAIQVIRWMPLATLTSGDELSERGLKILLNEVGYHRVNIAMILAGGSWAMYAARDLPKHRIGKLAMVWFAAILLFAVMMTGGRMGLVTWVVLAVAFSAWKWRRLLLVGPALLILAIAVVPAARDRLMQGFGGEVQTNNAIAETLVVEEGKTHWYTVTSGRSFAWPFVVAEIAKAPLLGYGRNAMMRTGLTGLLLFTYGESFPHPHNAYLQWLLDNGILGSIPVFAMFLIFTRRSLFLFRHTTDICSVTIGGVCLALLLAFLVASIGSQTFYPREGAVGMWCAIGLMLRVDKMMKSKLSAAPARLVPAGATA